jgi:WD40 repeat protein/serine/threonine protein kinase
MLAESDGAAGGTRLQKLGDYRILREVGRGGMGVVYEAEQESLGRRVALKVLSAGALADPAHVRRFEREAKAAARLHHTNIVPVFGVGRQDGHHYYVMQFIAGLGLDLVLEDLRRLRLAKGIQAALEEHGPPERPVDRSRTGLTAAEVAQSLVSGRFATNGSDPGGATATEPFDGADATTPPPIHAEGQPAAGSSSVALLGSSELTAVSDPDRRYYRSVARIGLQVAEALDYANRQGVLHRDIKPSNLLLDNRGNVWVADFGLAKTAEADNLTHTGDILGTVRYMAPERFQGRCDARSEVYSLGLTLYELVALRPAYQSADRHALIERVLHEEPARLKRLAPSVPRDLETIIAKATARDPAARYASAAALGEDLQRFVEDRPIRARRVSTAERLLRWGRRNKAVAALLMCVVVTLAVGFAVSTAQWIRADRHATREAALRAKMARDLYTSDMFAIQQAWDAGNVDRMEKLLSRHIPTEAGQDDWRGFEWYVFWRDLQRARPISTFRVNDTAWLSAATPDGRTLATLVYVHAPNPADERVDITLWDSATDWKPRTFQGTPETFGNAIALSPDGRFFATGRFFDRGQAKPHLITLWDAETGTPTRSGPEGHQAKVTDLAFSPDGKKLLWGDPDSTIKLWDLETGAVRTIEAHLNVCGGVEFDPKGRWIASSSWLGTVKLFDLESGDEVQSFSILGATGDVAFSPDGRYLAAGSSSGARMWDLTRPKEPREVELKGQRNTAGLYPPKLSFSPDGRYLAAGSSNTFRLWEVESGQSLATLRGHSSQVCWTTFLDGGRVLASGSEDRTVRFWDVGAALAERDVLTAHTGGVAALAITPDGQTLVSGGADGRIRTWAMSTGRPLVELEAPGVKEPVEGLAISPDGRTLADSRVGLWDLKTARLVELGSEHTDGSVVAFSPVDPIVAMAQGGNTRLWDTVSGKPLRPIATSTFHGVNCLAFSTDGKVLATAGAEGFVTLWEVATGRQITNNLLGHTGMLRSLAYSPDGRTLASASEDGTVILWDVADPARPSLRLKLAGNAGAVGAVAYSPDGTMIASGCDDGTVKLWDPATGRERCTLVGHSSRVRTLAFSPDGSVLATGDAGGTIRLWRR